MPQPRTCDASVISHLTDPPAMIGPCVLHHGHDGPAHKAANGTSWTALDRPLGSRLLIDDRTAERRAEQADQPEYIEVASYRTDAGHTAWAMRCWGDGTCDGLVSLDHDTEQWAVVVRDRHLAEAHNVTTPQAGQPQADGPLVLDRAVATAMRDCLNHLLGDEPADDGAPAPAYTLTHAPVQTCQDCGAGYVLGTPCAVCMFKADMGAEVRRQIRIATRR